MSEDYLLRDLNITVSGRDFLVRVYCLQFQIQLSLNLAISAAF